MPPADPHMIVSAPGYQAVTTHIFVAGDRYLNSDAVFAVKNSLVVDFKRQQLGSAPDGSKMDSEYWAATYDFRLIPTAK